MKPAALAQYAFGLAKFLAKIQFNREQEFDQEIKLAGFQTALRQYSECLWQYVLSHTPDELVQQIDRRIALQPNEARHDCEIGKVDFLWRRACYLQGLSHGKATDAEWHKWFGKSSFISSAFDDMEPFQKQAVRHKNPRKGEQEPAREVLLAAWLAGGLWRMSSEEQYEWLKAHSGFSVDYLSGKKAVAVARKRLGLPCPQEA